MPHLSSFYFTPLLNLNRSHSTKSSNAEREEAWAKKRGAEYNMTDTSITVSMDTEGINKTEEVKNQPIWMKESTVDGAVQSSQVNNAKSF